MAKVIPFGFSSLRSSEFFAVHYQTYLSAKKIPNEELLALVESYKEQIFNLCSYSSKLKMPERRKICLEAREHINHYIEERADKGDKDCIEYVEKMNEFLVDIREKFKHRIITPRFRLIKGGLYKDDQDDPQ